MATKTDDERKGCIFQWKIENVSHCWLTENQRIISPTFIADEVSGTKWSLCLYPKGKEKHINLYLYRNKDCSGPDVIEVKYELAILNEGGSGQKRNAKHTFSKACNWGYKKFIEQERVFVTERETFISEDTLTLQCTIWSNGEAPVKPQYLYARTVYGVNRRFFEWRINEFGSLKSGLINEFKDNSFRFDLLLYEALNFEKKLAININLVNKGVKYFSFKIFIIDSDGNKEDCGTQEYFEDDLKKGILFTLFCTKKLMENKSRYLQNDVLSLDCEYVYSNGSVLYEYYGRGIISPKSKSEVMSMKQNNIENVDSLNSAELVKDLKFMHNESIFTDTELCTSTRNFPAHKAILSARSPVFMRMFSHDMKEKNSGQVNIIDLEDDTIHRMLLYIYTDSLKDMMIASALQLYAAAEKYEILSLKSRCSSFLKQNLCSINACEVLLLADQYQDADLKSFVQDYILEHDKEVFGSLEFKNFMDANLKLAADLMYRKVYPV